MNLHAACLIDPYTSPQYLVSPIGDTVDSEELDALRTVGFSVVDTNVIGWEPYNAIIRYDDNTGTRWYLAKVTAA